MDYLLKSYRLDEDVVKKVTELKQKHGSVNKGLRVLLRLDAESVEVLKRTPDRERKPLLKPSGKLI